MKILILNAILYTAETNEIPKVKSIKDTMIYTLCLGFLKQGHTPVLVAAEDYRPVEEEAYPFEIVFLKCRLKKLFPPRCFPFQPSLLRYLSKNKNRFDLIISSEVFSLCSLMAVLAAKNKVMIWHELGLHNKILKKIPSKVWYNAIARTVFRNVPVVPRSQRAFDFISNYCGNVSRTFIDHGVNLDLFYFSRSKKKQFAVVARLVPGKKIDGMIERFSVFLKQYDPGFMLYIIGEGPLKDELKARAVELGIGRSVVFTGYRKHEEMVGILAGSQALLINTVKDNNMISIVESIVSATPVLTNGVPTNTTYIKKEKLGIVKDSWDSEDLIEISKNNAFYVENCIAYREKLSNLYCAEQFLKLAGLLHE